MRPDMDAIKARLRAATPNTWRFFPYGDDGDLNAGDVAADDGPLIGHDVMGVDAAFIMGAHNTDVAALLKHIETVEALLKEYYDRGTPVSRVGQRDESWYCFDCKKSAYEHDDIQHTADCIRTRTANALGLSE